MLSLATLLVAQLAQLLRPLGGRIVPALAREEACQGCQQRVEGAWRREVVPDLPASPQQGAHQPP
jgi:hypothetical protein